MAETLLLEGQKEYEVGFWVTAEEAAIEVSNILEAAGMTIGTKVPVTSLKLAYPIKKHTSAFFGSCIFVGLPENVKQVDEALALNSKVVRTLIITPPVKVSAREPRVVSEDGVRVKVVSEIPKASKPIMDMPVLSNEGLEKKLEEILK